MKHPPTSKAHPTPQTFFAWLRGESRRIWASYPLRNEFKASKLIPVQPHHNMSNRVKRVGQCNQCNNWFAASNLEVDHINAAGGFTNWNEWLIWMTRLLCDESNLQLLCKPCHKIKSYADRLNCSFDEAATKKKIIAFKLLTQQEQIDTLLSLGLSCKEIAKTKSGRGRQYESICSVGSVD
jgi:hypothetical protein